MSESKAKAVAGAPTDVQCLVCLTAKPIKDVRTPCATPSCADKQVCGECLHEFVKHQVSATSYGATPLKCPVGCGRFVSSTVWSDWGKQAELDAFQDRFVVTFVVAGSAGCWLLWSFACPDRRLTTCTAEQGKYCR